MSFDDSDLLAFEGDEDGCGEYRAIHDLLCRGIDAKKHQAIGEHGHDDRAVYGVEERDLSAYYAKRTPLKREVMPKHVPAAVFALTGGDLSQITGLHTPFDSGVAAGFLR